MPCPPLELLIAYAAGELAPDEREPVSTHLGTTCSACEREVAAVAELRRIERSGELEDPPLTVLRRAERVPADARSRSLRSLAGRVAALVFDARRDPLPSGARSSATTARQSLFRALDYDIDVRVSATGASAARVSGQVLPGPDRPLDAVAGLEVALVGTDGSTLVAETSELGEFDFGPCAEGEYTLAVEAAEDRLLVENLFVHLA
jgi:anti-sigma factor RsiW